MAWSLKWQTHSFRVESVVKQVKDMIADSRKAMVTIRKWWLSQIWLDFCCCSVEWAVFIFTLACTCSIVHLETIKNTTSSTDQSMDDLCSRSFWNCTTGQGCVIVVQSWWGKHCCKRYSVGLRGKEKKQSEQRCFVWHHAHHHTFCVASITFDMPRTLCHSFFDSTSLQRNLPRTWKTTLYNNPALQIRPSAPDGLLEFFFVFSTLITHIYVRIELDEWMTKVHSMKVTTLERKLFLSEFETFDCIFYSTQNDSYEKVTFYWRTKEWL